MNRVEWSTGYGRLGWARVCSPDGIYDLVWRLQGYHWSEAFQNEVFRMVVPQPSHLAITTQVAPAVTLMQTIAVKLESAVVAVGDFLVLTAQIIRVNKWKICPIVEFPNEATETR
jgi:hypothetical protein